MRIPFTILCVLAASALTSHAAQLATAKVLQTNGSVIKHDATGSQSPLEVGDILSQGDSVVASALSSAMLVFSNGSEITVNENTTVSIAKLEQQPFAGSQNYEQLQADPSESQTLLEVNHGELSFHVKKLNPGSSFNIDTPIGTAAIRGTQGTVSYTYNETTGELVLTVTNLDGLIDLISEYSSGNAKPVAAGKATYVRINRMHPDFDELYNLILGYLPKDKKAGKKVFPEPKFTPEDPGVIVISPEGPGSAAPVSPPSASSVSVVGE